MVSIVSQTKEAGKLSKRYLLLDKKFKIFDVVKKKKTSQREIANQFNICQKRRFVENNMQKLPGKRKLLTPIPAYAYKVTRHLLNIMV